MKQQGRRLWRLVLLLCMSLCVSLLACTGEKEPKDKVADLEFTVVPEREIPEELQELIRDKQICDVIARQFIQQEPELRKRQSI